jgi:hypothetical protein
LLRTLTDRELTDLQWQFMLLLRYRYGPRTFETTEEIVAYMESPEKKRGDTAGLRLRAVRSALQNREDELVAARARSLTPA